MNRRLFCKQAATISAGFTLAGCATPTASTTHASATTKGQKKPWFAISLAEWSLNQALFGKKLDHLDFPKLARTEFGIEIVEYVNQFFKDKAKDAKYLADLKKRCEDHGVRSHLIMVDGEGDLGHADPKERLKSVENHYKWFEAAKTLGCTQVRVNAHSTGSFMDQAERCADGLRWLAEFAQPLGLNVLVENHGGLSSNGKWVAAVMKKVNRPNCGTLPDFGNFDKDYDRYLGIEEMLPWAKGVSAKSHDFNAQGDEMHTDFRRMLRMVKAVGFRGIVGVEWEGKSLDEYAGIKATKRLLERVRDELA